MTSLVLKSSQTGPDVKRHDEAHPESGIVFLDVSCVRGAENNKLLRAAQLQAATPFFVPKLVCVRTSMPTRLKSARPTVAPEFAQDTERDILERFRPRLGLVNVSNSSPDDKANPLVQTDKLCAKKQYLLRSLDSTNVSTSIKFPTAAGGDIDERGGVLVGSLDLV